MMTMMMSMWCFCCRVQTPKPDDLTPEDGSESSDAVSVTCEVSSVQSAEDIPTAEDVSAVVAPVKHFIGWVTILFENYFSRFGTDGG
jgi:hypothetical protein